MDNTTVSIISEVIILKVLQRVGVMNYGGQETLWMNVIRNCNPDELKIDFLVKDADKGTYEDEIRCLGGTVYHQPNYIHKNKILRSIEKISIIKNFFDDHPEYQVMHINTYLAIDAVLDVLGAKLAKVSCIVVHSHNSDGPHKLMQFIFRNILNSMKIKRIACSERAAEWMYGTAKGIPIINNGIDVEKFKMIGGIRKSIREQLGISTSEILIGHVGRFEEQKNHLFLVEIFNVLHKRDNRYKLLFVGTGYLEDKIKKKVKEFDVEDSVIFYGNSNKVNELMMAMDLFVFPSLYEGLPFVLVEAQSSGLRCVCSNTISKETFITDLVTTVSLEKDADYWANMIINKTINTREDYTNIIKRKGFDIATTVEQLQELYSSG